MIGMDEEVSLRLLQLAHISRTVIRSRRLLLYVARPPPVEESAAWCNAAAN